MYKKKNLSPPNTLNETKETEPNFESVLFADALGNLAATTMVLINHSKRVYTVYKIKYASHNIDQQQKGSAILISTQQPSPIAHHFFRFASLTNEQSDKFK